MFKIGEFSRMTLVPSKTLRYYDEIDLFKPEQIDPYTGYRYYSTAQIPRLSRLLALKDLGLSLEQVAQLLDEQLTPEQIKGMLKLKQTELKQALREGQTRLARVETWLRQLEREDIMSDYTVATKTVQPMLAATVRGFIPDYNHLGELWSQLQPYLEQQQAKVIRPNLILWHSDDGAEKEIDAEVVEPLEQAVPEKGAVKVYTLAGVEKVAYTVHYGSYATIYEAYQALGKWVESNGYRVNGATRQIHVEYDDDKDPSTYVTEIQYPILAIS